MREDEAHQHRFRQPGVRGPAGGGGGPDSAPIKRMVQESRERGMLIDATYGRKTASIFIMDSDHVVLSALPPERFAPKEERENEE